jgi:uncharacterized protein YjlB
MNLLEDVKRIAGKATGWKRPDDPRALLRERKPQTYRFKDDGLIPNHPKWPLVIYKSAIRLPQKAGDVAILPAGTGHQCLKASEDFLVVGAYPPSGTYDECTSLEDRKKALTAIPRVARPRKDPVYGKDGPVMRAWRKPTTGR